MRASAFVLVTAITLGAASPVWGLEVSVKDYGAKGDGATDDRVAIQAAINAVNQAGGGIVKLPEGVYVVTAPNKGSWEPQLRLCNRLTLRGVGMHKSIVKIADHQGAYDALFAGTAIEGFSMMDLAVDANGETNPVVTKTDDFRSPYLHTPVYLPKAKDIAIQRCRFTNLSGVWAVYLPGRAENVLIDSCLFDNIGGYTKNDWDHSCIRVDGYGPCVVSNNVMSTRFGAGTTGARTAVELHGSNHYFVNNLISGFRYGVNVCSGGDGKTTEPSVHQYYIGNKLVNVGCGFSIWGIGNRRYDNLVLERNDITIDVTGWRNFFPDFYGIGIVSYRGVHPPTFMENVRIADNHIRYLNTAGGTDRSCGIRLDFSIYTDRWSENPAGQMVSVVLVRNTISSAYSTAIDVNCEAKNMEMSHNTIIDPARGVKQEELRCAVRLRGSLDHVRIANNVIYTHQDAPIACGIYDAAKNLGYSVIGNNRLSGAEASQVPVYVAGPQRSGADWKSEP